MRDQFDPWVLWEATDWFIGLLLLPLALLWRCLKLIKQLATDS